MKLFYLENCPHCKRARAWMEELYQENSAYRQIPIEMIEESQQAELADSYDYYYVPCFFDGDQKLHEGVASKEIIRSLFDNYLRGNSK
ncbi:glutaredoxin family protein [Candidatus Stoquefichus sp. SB1]|jgi:glutaredoxin|uniref:glutaredoxin family protein n=1 Tax=Candidatus Stoquefichus sp. SB1 TaxID=1658109 RepID=UPI00067ED9A3|nr:glutathione S-transferase N-terminal domain-containing protein [Candidatus Stoquefichus sp. SB1]